jgi:hypothetical protein
MQIIGPRLTGPDGVRAAIASLFDYAVFDPPDLMPKTLASLLSASGRQGKPNR